MIVAKCPLRISLAGGSTDLETFIDEHGRGAVVSFPATLHTYITLHDDLLGYNSYSKKYIINYSQREECKKIEDIKNDVAREVLSYFNLKPLSVGFTTDVFSVGSGLASSSSYVLSFIKAAAHYTKWDLSDFEICKIGLEIERRFNPLTGYQDPYGCGLGGFKRMDFVKGKDPQITFLSRKIFNEFDMFLIYTGISRHSTAILKEVTKCPRVKLLEFVDRMQDSLEKGDSKSFLSSIKEGWEYKKKTSSNIMNNRVVQNFDRQISNDSRILAHRLCGAGNGGYFLVFMNKHPANKTYLSSLYDCVLPIGISAAGCTARTI